MKISTPNRATRTCTQQPLAGRKATSLLRRLRRITAGSSRKTGKTDSIITLRMDVRGRQQVAKPPIYRSACGGR